MTEVQSTRVLIVDDDVLVLERIEKILERLQYTVVGRAVNGVQAVELAQTLQPDIILMDIKMPELDGIAAAQRIQEYHPTPVVMLTAYDDPELIAQARDAGVVAYMVKPPKATEVPRVLSIALARFQDMQELRRLNAKLQTEIAERKRIETTLRHRTEELQARNEELDAFAHTLAHDLQNLLGPIIGFAEVLAEEYATMPGEQLKEYLQVIARKERKMGNIINDLLLLAGVRNIEAEMSPLDMASIVAEARQRLAYRIEEYEAEVILPASWPVALGYGPWVEEVWVNYLSNAIKYGGRPPRVELGADFLADVGEDRIAKGRHVCFWVRDNGPGLTPEQQAKLFAQFERLSQTRTEGHGLGLSIVRRIVEKLDGQVGVESEVGLGSTFFFTLPVGQCET